MNPDITYEFVRAVMTRDQHDVDCDCWICAYLRREEAQRKQFPPLRLVPNCGGLLKGRDQEPPTGPAAA